jgi:ElaB/YqjD/DUF883 family membrane-anchored ribosome-binding protein
MNEEPTPTNYESIADDVNRTAEEASNRLKDKWETGKAKFSEAQHRAEDYARAYPWTTMGIALGLGLVFGLLASGGRRD